jgi:predicted DNA-binding transcriptional regulator AlpA
MPGVFARQLACRAVLIDPADLLDANEVADTLGLAHRQAVATYRRRYSDFPEPIVVKAACMLWRRQDVEAWARGRGRSSVSPQ